jgi:hypothetical protein
MDSVPLTPQAELAAYPSPPKSIASQLSQLKRHSTPPRNRPRRTSTPPRMSLPLDRLTPPPSGPLPPRPKLHRKSHTSELSISTLNRKPTPRRTRPRNVTYPSPTAGGRPELPASYPPVFVARTPRGKNPNPAFHHISLPSPQEPPSASSIRRNESTATSYSIPIGLGVEQKQETKQEMKEQNNNWPIHNHPVTSDAHHLREQPSYVSALSVARDLQNASAVSALTTSSSVPPIPEAEIETMPRLKHNHSMEWEHPKSAQKQHHVMSWQNYSAAGSPIAEADDREPQTSISTATTEVSPMFSPPTHSEKNYTVVSPMLSPPAPGQAGYKGWHHYSYDGEPATPQIGMAERLSIKVGLTPMIGNKLFSQKSLQKREQERKELMGQYGDLSVQPLNPERRRNGRKATY